MWLMACTAEAAGAAASRWERIDLARREHGDGRQHELGDPLAVVDLHGRIAEVDEDDLELSTVVGVDCTWSVEDREPMAQGKSRARPDLALEPGGDRQGQSSGDQTPF